MLSLDLKGLESAAIPLVLQERLKKLIPTFGDELKSKPRKSHPVPGAQCHDPKPFQTRLPECKPRASPQLTDLIDFQDALALRSPKILKGAQIYKH